MNEINYKNLAKKLPWAKGVRLVKTDKTLGIIAVHKPSGIKAHPNAKGIDTKSILKAPYDDAKECYQCFDDLSVHLLHRLDSPTSGLILLCLNDEVAKLIRRLFRDRTVEKTYYALVRGQVRVNSTNWKDRLVAAKEKGKLRAQVRSDADIAETQVKLLKVYPKQNISLLQLTPKTGRTHQLRIQASMRNHPILGDKTYGNFTYNAQIKKDFGLKELCLHAQKIEFKCTYKNKVHPFSVEDPWPLINKNFELQLTPQLP